MHFVPGVKISEAPSIRSCDYNPASRTALFDAVHLGIEMVEGLKEPNGRVACIIITDGEDNASKTHVSCKNVKKLVKKYDIKADWSFTYIGRPYEYWRRTKSVSTVSYDCNAQRHVCQRLKTVPATVRRQRIVNGQGSDVTCR